jgi:hypothetical protein
MIWKNMKCCLKFEDKDMAAGFLSCTLNADCFDVNEEGLALQTEVSILKHQWGAKDVKVYNGLFFNQWGDTKKWEALSGIENGEQIFVVYNRLMLIAILDSIRGF